MMHSTVVAPRRVCETHFANIRQLSLQQVTGDIGGHGQRHRAGFECDWALGGGILQAVEAILASLQCLELPPDPDDDAPCQ